MSQEYCACCGAPLSAEGTMICWSCEQGETKLGLILQSQNATKEEVKRAYEELYADRGGASGKKSSQ